MLRALSLALLLAGPSTAGGDAPDGATWRAEDIGGRGIADGARVTLTLNDGHATGHGGCNTFGSSYEIAEGALTFGPMRATRMACAPVLMITERAVFDALRAVTGYRIDETGALLLLAGETVAMRLRR